MHSLVHVLVRGNIAVNAIIGCEISGVIVELAVYTTADCVYVILNNEVPWVLIVDDLSRCLPIRK